MLNFEEALIEAEKNILSNNFDIDLEVHIVKEVSITTPSWIFLLIHAKDKKFEELKKKYIEYFNSEEKKKLLIQLVTRFANNNFNFAMLMYDSKLTKIYKSMNRMKDLGLDYDFIITPDVIDDSLKSLLICGREFSTNIKEHYGKSCISYFLNLPHFVSELLNLGASPLLKNEVLKFALDKQSFLDKMKKEYRYDEGVAIQYWEANHKTNLKFDDFNAVDSAINNKFQGAINVFKKNGYIKDSKDLPKVVTFNFLMDALTKNDENILVNLAQYKDVLLKEKNYGKNLLFYAIEKGKFEWVRKIVDDNLVSRNDVGGGKQQAITHAILKSKTKITQYLYDNNWFKDDYEKDKEAALEIFVAAAEKMEKFALKIQGEQKLPIDLTEKFIEKYSFWLKDKFIERDKIIKNQKILSALKNSDKKKLNKI